jgi:hypothetical protein
MKKVFISAFIGIASLLIISCGNNTESNTHTHEDGSTHTDHDTTQPMQEEFMVSDSTHMDSIRQEHTHKDGEKHSH